MPINLQYALWGIMILLIVSTFAIGLKTLIKPNAGDRELWLRMGSWWVIAGLFVAAIALGRAFSITYFGLISFLAFKEYLNIIPARQADKRLYYLAYLAVPLQYLWIWLGWNSLFFIFIPVYLFLIVSFCLMIAGETQGFLKAASSLHWGLMATVFLLSHVAYLLALPDAGNPAAGSAGLLLFLAFLTQFNDVLQFIWGKLFGKTKIVPKISPSKTLEGLLGGIISTTLLAWLLAPYLTPLLSWEPLAAGIIIGFGGFAGDVLISAIKRDIGIKDASNLIPGHGGVLDRIDSLIVSAPLFFYFVYYLHY
jgi:phosphatidate cytidylyltransferase